MRDLLVAAIIFGSVPVSIYRPDIGMLVYVWIGLMNPHRLSWRMAEAPVGLVVAIATMLGTVIRGMLRPIPMRLTTVLLVFWVLYCTGTTLNAGSRDAWVEWNRFSRILLMCFVALMLFQDRKRLNRFLWVCMASVAFFGVKGGIFSIATAGQYRVWGPAGSFIEGNNELALAELMVLPLLLYFLRQESKPWKKWAYYASVVLVVLAVLFSYSRGAFVAFGGLALLLMARSRFRVQAFLMLLVFGLVAMLFVPQHWMDRMFSIRDFRTDESAVGRLNAWQFSINLAQDRLFGGGFRTFTPELFALYAPNPADVHDAHSIYFEVLAEQGYPGLVLYLGILIGTLWRLERLRRAGRRDAQRRWIGDLAEMLQFSIVAYALGGAFLGLAYFDLYYYIVIAALLLDHLAAREWAAARAAARGARERAAALPEPAVAPARA